MKDLDYTPQLSFGDPAEHLCNICYSTEPAARWDKRVKELEEEHRHDFDS